MSEQRELQSIPFRDIPHVSELFSSYIDDFARVARFYGHPPTADGIGAAAREVNLDPATRRSVVDVLREQNRKFGGASGIDSTVNRNLDRLAVGAVAIVTGQQPGLFSGPAYSFYKAITAIRCAEETTHRGIEAVPIFWIATEDHDLAEINHAFWNTREGLSHYEVPPRDQDSGRCVGEVALGDSVRPAVEAAVEALDGPCSDEISRALRECYTPSETYGSAFAKLMSRVLASRGMVFLDPLDARLHELARPVYSQVFAESDDLRDALLARSRDLESAGLHAQVKVTPESTLLFCKISGRREPLRLRERAFFAGEEQFSREQIAAKIEKAPAEFSANALLRPVVQDALLPTAAYIGGPAEIAYLAQSQVLYRRLLGRMPAVLPRASFSVVEPAVARFLGLYDLGMPDMLAGAQHVRSQMERKSLPGGLPERFDKAEHALGEILDEFRAPMEALDSTLGGALQTTREKILHQLDQLRGKAGRAENFRTGVLDRHQQILFDALYPKGGLQERSLSLLPSIAAHGPGLLDELLRFSPTGESGSNSIDHKILFF